MGCIAFHNYDGIRILHTEMLPTVALITTALGSYLPDIDLQQSHLGQKYYFISKHLSHRGLTHMWYVIPLILLGVFAILALLPVNAVKVINMAALALLALSLLGIVLPALKKGNIDLLDMLNASLSASAVVTLIGDLYDSTVICSLVFGLFFGWIMHIFADAFNGKGIPLIPGMKKFHLMNVKTKSYNEKGLLSSNWQEPVWLACYCAVVLLFTFKGYIL